MSLPYRQQRILRRAERALGRSDPHLAAMLSIFAGICKGEEFPVREQVRVALPTIWCVLSWPLRAAVRLAVPVRRAGYLAYRCLRCAALACAHVIGAGVLRLVRRDARGVTSAGPGYAGGRIRPSGDRG